MHVFGSGQRGWTGGEWMRGMGLGFTCENSGSVGRMSVFGLRWCGWCRRGVVRGLGPGSGGGMLWCYVCVRYESGLCV